MKILVFTCRLNIGGTEVNTVELSAALRNNHGHDVVLVASSGPLLAMVEEKKLRFLSVPDTGYHPSRLRVKAFNEIVHREKPDIVHVWDWRQCLDAYVATQMVHRVPMVVTDMSMSIERLLPRTIPTTFGTPQLVDQARRMGRKPVELLVPPVDTTLNAPGSVDSEHFRQQWNIKPSDITLVTVSRLDNVLKGESIRRTFDTIEKLGNEAPLRLMVVGDGPARGELQEMAQKVNSKLRREAIILTGALVDPRPAYDSANIVVGMGGSALRGMAFGKPVIVVGEFGFSKLLAPQTAEQMYYQGMFGHGSGSDSNSELIDNVRYLYSSPAAISTLGDFGREFVVRRFSLDSTASRFNDFLSLTASRKTALAASILDGVRTGALCIRDRSFLPDGHFLRSRFMRNG